MTTERRIDDVCAFLREYACGDILLKRPDDDDPERVEWAHPQVHGVYIPRLPEGQDWLSPTPCVIVGPLNDTRQRDEGTLTLRLLVMTWDPGTREDVEEEPVRKLEIDREGWRALYTFMERIQGAMAEHVTIGDMEVGFPMETALYSDGETVPDLRPYYLGQIDVPMRYVFTRRRSPHTRRLLD